MQRIFTLGICAMETKVESAPMQSILELLRSTGDFEIIVFPERTILEKPITEWPIVECLIAFYSYKFPLEKAIEYVKRYKPIVLNDLEKQRIFRSRIDVYHELQSCRVPHPNYVLVDHEAVKSGIHTFEEQYDYIVYNNVRINKPFIEKPVDSDNHNNWIYYPTNAGGGCKKLFRKIHDRSSKYCADVHSVRRNGKYIYEEFMSTFGTDIKVYTVGCMFAHAEARKSPALDGKVNRYADGKEVRFPVILTSKEKTIAYRIVDHFDQTVCGFDILRTIDGPYVCDINGWSFVKRNKKYHMDCSHIIRIMFLLKLEAKYNIILRNVIPAKFVADETAEALRKTFADAAHRYGKTDSDEELCSVIVVMRHGDRKPKQKLKFVTKNQLILSYFENRPGETQIKLKSPEEMRQLLRINESIMASLESEIKSFSDLPFPPSRFSKELTNNCTPEIKELMRSFANHKELDKILKIDESFTGINRKVQLKAIYGDSQNVEQVLLVAKWGGELTSVGKCQAEDLGRRLRQSLYPTDSSGLIRLHSTYRHDFKIFSSDEGRCQITSAAFTKGILDLEGELTPILVTMTIRNEKAHALLDDNSEVEERNLCKARLSSILENWEEKEKLETLLSQIENDGGHYYKSALEEINFKMSDLEKLHAFMIDFLAAIKHEITRWMCLYSIDEYANNVVDILYDMQLRWKRLLLKFRNQSEQKFVFTKIADIVDNVRYDLIHHHFYLGEGLDLAFEIYNIVQRLSSVLSPCEYGVTPQEKLKIGVKVAWKLLRKILRDVTLHRNFKDDLNQSNDIYRNRDLLYATLVAPNTIDMKMKESMMRRKLASILEGSCDSLTYKSNEMPTRSFSPEESTRNNVAKTGYEPTGAISVVAAASASAASVAASCLALSSGSKCPKTLKEDNDMCFIGGIKPSEMYLYSSKSQTEELLSILRENAENLEGPRVINSSTLWVHYKGDILDSKDKNVNLDPGMVVDDGDLVRLEANEARKLGIRSPYRMVRSRYYVTSASHLFSLLNFFKYAHYLNQNCAEESPKLVEDDMKDLHYLSHIVLRVWCSNANSAKPVYRLEISVSSGAKDGFGQNYELLAQNARSQKNKYKRHIQRFNLGCVQDKILCRRCRTSIDFNCINEQSLEQGKLVTTKNKLKRSSSTRSVLKGGAAQAALEFGSGADVKNVQPQVIKDDQNGDESKGYLCRQCFAEPILLRQDASTALPCGKTASQFDDTRYKIDTGVVPQTDKSTSPDFPRSSKSTQSSVPPYCELSKLVVINHNCKLTVFESYVNKVFYRLKYFHTFYNRL